MDMKRKRLKKRIKKFILFGSILLLTMFFINMVSADFYYEGDVNLTAGGITYIGYTDEISLRTIFNFSYSQNKWVDIVIAYPSDVEYIDNIINPVNHYEEIMIRDSPEQRYDKVLDKQEHIRNRDKLIIPEYDIDNYKIKVYSVKLEDVDKLLTRFNFKGETDERFYIYLLGSFSGGSGTAQSPYIINYVDELENLRLSQYNANYFILNRSLDFNNPNHYKDIGFKPLFTEGWGFNPIEPFYGFLDGNNKVLRNLYINRPVENNVGLFGYTQNAEIKNIGLLDVNITGNTDVGALSGYNTFTEVYNAYSTGNVEGSYGVGGLLGYQGDDILNNSYSTVNVEGNDDVGGLVGEGWYFSIQNSYATGNVEGNDNVGGLLGAFYDDGNIKNSYATGNVSGNNRVGGLAGRSSVGPFDPHITNSYSTGNVEGNDNVGGLLGSFSGVDIENSFWDINTSGQTTSDGGEGKTTTEMMDIETFYDAGWDIKLKSVHNDEIWFIDDGNDYPRLFYQEMEIILLNNFEDVELYIGESYEFYIPEYYLMFDDIEIYYNGDNLTKGEVNDLNHSLVYFDNSVIKITAVNETDYILNVYLNGEADVINVKITEFRSIFTLDLDDRTNWLFIIIGFVLSGILFLIGFRGISGIFVLGLGLLLLFNGLNVFLSLIPIILGVILIFEGGKA